MKNKDDLNKVFQNCFNRGCTPEQLQDFIDRVRCYWMDHPEMIALIDDLEVKYITSLGEGKEV
ncbi:hypothetical protein MKX41_30630 [Paenibacillus sp. FSL R5-0475]|uniref:hypothetical protein n=1 Tax=Paenibacillus sp. FSL R5-0475 TaxID=2921643 RepID=UPI0030F92556